MKIKDFIEYLEGLDQEEEITKNIVSRAIAVFNREHFVCKICGKAMIGKAGLSNHIRHKHKEGE